LAAYQLFSVDTLKGKTIPITAKLEQREELNHCSKKTVTLRKRNIREDLCSLRRGGDTREEKLSSSGERERGKRKLIPAGQETLWIGTSKLEKL